MAEEEYVLIGWVVKPHGVEGRIVVALFPEFETIAAIDPDITVYLGYSQRFALPYRLRAATVRSGGRLLVELQEIQSREEVFPFREMGLFVPRASLRYSRPVEKTTDHPVVGYAVRDAETDQIIGVVADVWEMPANDVIVVQQAEKLYPIPWVDAFVLAIDEQRQQITVRLIEGISEIALPVSHRDEQAMDEN